MNLLRKFIYYVFPVSFIFPFSHKIQSENNPYFEGTVSNSLFHDNDW